MQDQSQLQCYPQHDRRRIERSIRTFRPACIEIAGKAYAATMKDCSDYGCGFDGEIPITKGETVRYRWGSRPFVTANVVWVDGTRFGLENEFPCEIAPSDAFPYRSVRIPFEETAAVYFGGRCIVGSARNIAQKGFCITTPEPVPTGCLSTLEIAGAVFENATVRWTDGDQAGFALDKPMSIPTLASLTNST
jgi:hypothetical protein